MMRKRILTFLHCMHYSLPDFQQQACLLLCLRVNAQLTQFKFKNCIKFPLNKPRAANRNVDDRKCLNWCAIAVQAISFEFFVVHEMETFENVNILIGQRNTFTINLNDDHHDERKSVTCTQKHTFVCSVNTHKYIASLWVKISFFLFYTLTIKNAIFYASIFFRYVVLLLHS